MNDSKQLSELGPVDKFQALQPTAGNKPKSYHKNTCKVCERPFYSIRKGAKTCGSICRQRWYRHTTGSPGSIKRWVKDHV